MKTALVTGGAGFVGTNLIRKLLKQGYKVVSIDNYITGYKHNHQEGCEYHEGDVSTITDYSVYGQFDIVYHLAALARIQPSFTYPLEYFQSNAVGTLNIAMYCVKNNIPMQFAGTSSHHSGKYKNPYTFAKDVSEDIIEMCRKIYGLKATITRFYNVYGPYHIKEGAYCTVIGKWEKAIENGQDMIINGTGEKRRDFTHIYDIVDALYLIDQKEAWGYLFELGRGTNFSINEVAEMYHYDKVVHGPEKPGEAMITLCTDTLAKDILGWNPTLNLPDYIQEWLETRKNG